MLTGFALSRVAHISIRIRMEGAAESSTITMLSINLVR